jgi:hypothetical protein
MRCYRMLTFLALLAVVAGFLPPWVPPAAVRADSAPMFESAMGVFAPGLPNNTVRMVAETVDIQVIERPVFVKGERYEGVLYAQVDAVFYFHNRGPDVHMAVGFPIINGDWPRLDERVSAGFESQFIRGFQAWSSRGTYSPEIRKVTTSQFGDNPNYRQNLATWFVWEMDFPGGQFERLDVSYLCQISDFWVSNPFRLSPGYSPVPYILTSGALWDGTIGDAIITVTAPDGGMLLSPAPQATLDTPGRVVWHMRDFEPNEDLLIYYLSSVGYRQLQAVEEEMAADPKSAADYMVAAQAMLLPNSTGRFGPHPTRNYHFRLGLEWAYKAMQLEPENAEAWALLARFLMYYDSPPSKWSYKGIPGCAPRSAIYAARKAMEFGLDSQPEKLGSLDWSIYEFAHWTEGWDAKDASGRTYHYEPRPICEVGK